MNLRRHKLMNLRRHMTLNLIFPFNHTYQQSIPLITSAALSPNLLRKQYPLRNRAMNYQFASRNNQETNTAVSYGSEDANESPPILNIEERGRNS